LLSSTDLETLPTARGKKLLVSGWWGLVRHPNYLGDIICQIAIGLSAGKKYKKYDFSYVFIVLFLFAGFGNFFPWAMPVLSILCLLHRVSRDNSRCQSKYGDAWSRYCDKVKHRVLPKIY
jgi:protein-S-isoprenylcysteine O-methyltransferase Ste14